ncbi:MAG: hypothetical protein V4757_22535 [Pseudomonadota bacterium]
MDTVRQRRIGGLNIAILLGDGPDHADLAGPRVALEESGAMVKLLGKTRALPVDLTFEQAKGDDFDGFLVAGNESLLRANADAARIFRSAEKEGKPLELLEGDSRIVMQRFLKALAERTRQSVRGTADDLPGAASMGG